MNRRIALLRLSLLTAGSLAATSSRAAGFPDHTLRIIVPYGAGGATDVAARVLAEELGAGFGQTVIVDNRPGGGGIVATDLLARSAPDGYTLLLMSSDAFTILPLLRRKPPYDALTSFSFVGSFAQMATVYATSSASGATTLNELVDRARRHPGQVTYGSAGVGSILHLAGEMLESVTGTEMIHVPYKSGAEMMNAVVSQQVDMAPVAPGLIMRMPSKVRALAVAAPHRLPDFPDVPTTAELGYAGLEAISTLALYAPAGLPAPLTRRLTDALARVVQSGNVQKRLATLGLSPRYMAPDAFTAFSRSEQTKWRRIVGAANIPLQD